MAWFIDDEKKEEAVFTAYTVYSVAIAQKKHRHVSFVDQNEEPSSKENSTPPIGLSKAAATRVIIQIDEAVSTSNCTSGGCPTGNEVPLLLVISKVLVLREGGVEPK